MTSYPDGGTVPPPERSFYTDQTKQIAALTSRLVPPTETRVVNETTGGEKGQKDQQFNLLPWEQLAEVARLYAFGTKKYAAHNWRKGYDWGLSFDAMLRHATQFWNGESKDTETQCSHLASVVFHALALMYFEQHKAELDDRPTTDRGDDVA